MDRCTRGCTLITICSIIVLILVSTSACDIAQSIPTVSPTPDRIATGVAEARAIAATLTAEIPNATPTVPAATSTPIPSETTPLPEPLTATPTLTKPITTSTTATPSITNTQKPEPAATMVGSVHGNVYGIEILSLEKTNSYQEMGQFPRYVYSESNHVFLEVRVLFYKLGEPIWDDQDINDLALVDTLNTWYRPEYAMVQGTLDPDGKFSASNYTIYFSIPENLSNFGFHYRDLSILDIWK